MLGGRSIQLAKVFGIRIGVDPSWFLVLFLVIYWLTGYYQDALPGESNSTVFGLATVSALLFFMSILLHELGHAVVAIRNRIAIAGIDLWLFGGIARMQRDTDSPGVELRVALAGPFVTFVIACACIGLGVVALVCRGGISRRDENLEAHDPKLSGAPSRWHSEQGSGAARIVADRGYPYDYSLQTMREIPYAKWRDYDPEDAVRFYALRLREAGMIKSTPNKIITQGTDWRFFNELKQELKS